MTAITNMRPGPKDLLQQLGPNLYRAAYQRGMRLSAFLDRELELDARDRRSGLDGFGLLLREAGIRTRSDPEYGVLASTYEEFNEHPQARMLIPEWMARQWRRVSLGGVRAPFASADLPPGTVGRPFADDEQPRFKQIAPAIPLDEVVSTTVAIDSDTFRALYLQDDGSSQRLVRITEGAELPRAKLVAGDQHTVRLYKYGRALEVTYEALRRVRLDLLSFYIQRLAIAAENDKVAQVIDTIVNGDGNPGTAATNHNLTALDPAATAGTLTLAGWWAFLLKFENPYAATTGIVQQDVMLQLMLLDTGSANFPLSVAFPDRFGGVRPMRQMANQFITVGWTNAAPAMKVVAFDSRFGIIRLTEVGSDITEVERFATRQVQVTSVSEVEGYMVFDPNAAHVLNINA